MNVEISLGLDYTVQRTGIGTSSAEVVTVSFSVLGSRCASAFFSRVNPAAPLLSFCEMGGVEVGSRGEKGGCLFIVR